MKPRREFSSLAVAAALFGLTATFRGEVKDDVPQVLPQVTVAGAVPLIKVAEYTMREHRFGAAAVVHDRFIYIIAGSSADPGVLDSIERFDVRTCASEDFARLRTARLWSAAVLVGDKIYVLGGSGPRLDSRALRASATRDVQRSSDQGGDPFELEASVEVVDLATRKVSRAPPMLEPRSQFACVVTGGKIHVLGGRVTIHSERAFTNATEIFDLATSRWSSGSPAPAPRASVATLVDGGFVIYPGGYNGRRALDDVDVFDPRDNSWRSLPRLCRTISAHSLVFLDHHLFLFGDYDRPDELLAYDLKTRQSEIFTLGYRSARHTAVAVVDRKIYVIGGKEFRDTVPLNTIQVFELTKKAAAPASGSAEPTHRQ
jgi:hypothetical protein